MLNFDFNSDEFSGIVQSVMTRIDFIKKMMSNLSEDEEIYKLYDSELFTLQSLLARFLGDRD